MWIISKLKRGEENMNKRLCIFTYILLVINLVFTLFFIIADIFFIIDGQFIFPIIFMFIASFCFIMISFNYYQSLLFLKGRDYEIKTLKRIKIINNIIICVSFIDLLSFSLILLYTLIFFEKIRFNSNLSILFFLRFFSKIK